MKKTILPAIVTLLILGTMLPSEAGAYTIHVDAAFGIDQPLCGSVPGPWACQTIQYAVDNVAGDGATVQLTPGTFNENVLIDKRITLGGAGSGDDPAVDSIIVSASPGTNVIRLTTGGASATERMIIRDLRVTGGAGGPNGGNGINIVGGSYMTFDNVAAVGNDGNGIAFDPGGDQTDFVVSNCNLSSNPGGTGFRVPTTASVDGLSITDSTMDNNAVIGLSMYGPVTDLYIDNSTFNDNAAVGIYGNLHRYFATKKSAVIGHVTANGNGRGIALRIYGGSVKISNSTVSANNNVNPEDIGQGLDLSVREADAAILLSSVTAEDNEDVNIFLETKNDGSLAGAFFEHVTVTGSEDEPSAVFCDGCGIWLHTLGTVAMSNVAISNSRIEGNNRGIVLEAETMPVSNVAIRCSDILSDGSSAGLVISGDAAAGNQAYYNKIVGNWIGVDNQDLDDTFDATDNWWGDAGGPYHPGTNPSGFGDEVSDNVAYDPWLIGTPVCGIFSDGFESGDTSAWSSTSQ
ncbi:MAG: hypothetical protein GY856_48570 [bacterium]|nr:hypothetical protein [bacterium]